MSYNISRWNTKKIENLKLPLSELYVSEREDWLPQEPEIQDDGTVIINCGVEQELIGTLQDSVFEIKEFNMSGEGSGSFMHYVLERALSNSTGYLEVVIIWEGGDSIEKFIVDNGKITRENIEL